MSGVAGFDGRVGPAKLGRMFQKALIGAPIFTGDDLLIDHALLLDGDRVVGMAPLSSLPRDTRMQEVDGLLAPGFVDIQVNGGGGVLFNDSMDAEGAAAIARAHLLHGCTAILPTFITGSDMGIAAAIAAVRVAIARGLPGVAGLHLEGPFIAPARKGVHDPAFMRPMAEQDLQMLLDRGIEHLLLTVAPEMVSPEQIRRLVRGGVVVSLGHSDADHETVSAAIDAGATGVTHLFNAMSQMSGRAPGLVGTALDRGEVWAGLIADLHHVDPVMMRIALAAKRGPGRLILVSDAMPPAAGGPDRFELGGRTVYRRDGRLELADGTLAGADLGLDHAVACMVASQGVRLEEALRMASLYPARFMSMDHRHGRIEAGRKADLVLLDDALSCVRTWQNGVETVHATPILVDAPSRPGAVRG